MSLLRHPVSLGLASVVVALAVSAGLVLAAGSTVATAAAALWDGMAGTPYAIGASLNTTAVLVLVSAGFIVAYRAGLVNVGGEGQIALGAISATAVGVLLPATLPLAIGVPLVLLAGAVGGGCWAAIPAWLLVRRGVNEVICTLLLNFVALALLTLSVHEEWLLRQPVTSAETLPQSEPLAVSTHLPLLPIDDSPATAGVVVALAAAVVVAVVLARTPLGTELRSIGFSIPASRRLGVAVDRLRFGSLTSAGALAGVAGAVLVASAPFVLADHISAGYGFTGLIAGLLARGSVAAAVGISAALGFLVSGGISVQIQAGVPAAITGITEALIILLIAATAAWALVSRRRPRVEEVPA